MNDTIIPLIVVPGPTIGQPRLRRYARDAAEFPSESSRYSSWRAKQSSSPDASHAATASVRVVYGPR